MENGVLEERKNNIKGMLKTTLKKQRELMVEVENAIEEGNFGDLNSTHYSLVDNNKELETGLTMLATVSGIESEIENESN